MTSNTATRRTLWEATPGIPVTIDQTRLPFEYREISLDSLDACAAAIRTMQVRGAPLIGAVAAWGMALAMCDDSSDRQIRHAFNVLMATRPTAVNLRWALERVMESIQPVPASLRADTAVQLARTICNEDIDCNRRIGEFAMSVLKPLAKANRPLQLLTHCNAGRIATIAYGTALAPMYLMAEAKVPFHVWVGETRPRNQGASLTAWELDEAGIEHTVVADNAGGLMMMRGEIDAVIVGCDRVAANGDVVNKIGTYLKALAAAAHAIPFYVACPTNTIDRRCASGMQVPIENRDPFEVTHLTGALADGSVATIRTTPVNSKAANPAFDVTPAAMVTDLITEKGICAASEDAITALFDT